ncbi:MAG: cryptochrome/photolyase family protein, partial [Angustibacter sp.]
MVESRSAFARRRYHRAKAHLMLSAMRHRAAELGKRCVYVRAEDFPSGLAGLGAVTVCQPTSRAVDRLVRGLPQVEVLPARGFVSSRDEFGQWRAGRGRRRLLLEDFYRDARRRHRVLLDGDDPVGGQWNFDADNRQPPPRGAQTLPVA